VVSLALLSSSSMVLPFVGVVYVFMVSKLSLKDVSILGSSSHSPHVVARSAGLWGP